MKHIRLSLFILAAASFAACTGDSTDSMSRVTQTPLQIELAEVTATRAAITGTTLPESSQYGIFVCKEQSRYTINGGNNVRVDYANGKSTPATSTLLPDNDCSVYAYYPYNIKATLTNMPLDVTTQTDYLFGTSADSGGAPILVSSIQPKARIRFSHAMVLLTLSITQEGEPAEPNIVSGIDFRNILYYANLNIMTGEMTGQIWESYHTSCNITVSTTPQTAEFLLIPMTTEADGLPVSLTINGKSYDARLPQRQWLAGMHYIYNVKINTSPNTNAKLEIVEASITPRDNTTMDGLTVNINNGNTNTPEVGGTIGTAVDLGLSVKWADHNVGASTETEVGGRYFWGDPTGKATSDTYSMPSLSNISDTQYDIAKSQWGGGWRLPTYDEIKELVDNTTYQWTTRNGVEGGMFTSKKVGYTNKSIFMPKYYGGDQGGSVWSGTKGTNSSNFAMSLYYGKNEVRIDNHGVVATIPESLSIRPVCK